MNVVSFQPATADKPITGQPIAGTLSILLIITLIGCGNDVTGPDDDDCPPDAVCVGMTSNSFVPANIEVEVGTTVLWINNSSEAHTVTSGSNGNQDGRFNSGNISPDGEYSYEFTEAGTYHYYCIPHVQIGMTGTVTVVNGNSN